MAYEVQIEDRKKDEQQQFKKKVLAFYASSYTENSNDEEEEMAMISRKFRKFLKQGKFKKNKDTNDNPLCFKCNKLGHMKKDCPLLKPKENLKFSINSRRRRKLFRQLGMTVTHRPLMKKKPLKQSTFVS